VSAKERKGIEIAGFDAHVYLLQTAMGRQVQEFDVCVATDACVLRIECSRDATFDRQAGSGAQLLTTELVTFEWLRTAGHDLFKQGYTLIKYASHRELAS